MDKFTNIIKNQKPEEKPIIKYDGYVKVYSYKDWEILGENDMIIVLPYLVDEGYILLRNEFIPTYQWSYKDIYKNSTNFLTILSGTMEDGETPDKTIRRELYEEAGIVLSNMVDLEIEKPLHVSKGSFTKYHTCILELRYNDFKLTKPVGDGSKSESLSKTIKVSLGDIDDLIYHDTITELMILKFKQKYNLK
jgi:8-oxo-dGTP pyrophosphatase MutT (NUDIX family)